MVSAGFFAPAERFGRGAETGNPGDSVEVSIASNSIDYVLCIRPVSVSLHATEMRRCSHSNKGDKIQLYDRQPIVGLPEMCGSREAQPVPIGLTVLLIYS
jgi:hypothetical protein